MTTGDAIEHPPSAPRPAAGSRRGPGDGTLTLLYVEDHPASVSVMEALLELRPAWCFVHEGLIATGVETARTRHPDLVLLDMHLPDGSGAQALATLKGDAATRDIPVVVLTASGGPPSRALLEAGAEQVWTKPRDLELMLAYFDEVAERTEAGRQR